MPWEDIVSEFRLGQVHPELARRDRALLNQLESEGFHMRVTRGIASVAQQDAIWQEGRDSDGKKVGETYTDAKGTQSNHVMGFAVDHCVMEAGEPIWDPSHPGYQRQIVLAPLYGLRSGNCFTHRDVPHLELLEVPEVPSLETQQTYLQAGVEGVWAEANIPTLAIPTAPLP